MKKPKWFVRHAVGLSKITLAQAAINILNGAMDLTTKIGWSHPIALFAWEQMIAASSAHTVTHRAHNHQWGLAAFLTCHVGQQRCVAKLRASKLTSCSGSKRTFGSKKPTPNGQTETYFRKLCFYVFMFAYMSPLSIPISSCVSFVTVSPAMPSPTSNCLMCHI